VTSEKDKAARVGGGVRGEGWMCCCVCVCLFVCHGCSRRLNRKVAWAGHATCNVAMTCFFYLFLGKIDMAMYDLNEGRMLHMLHMLHRIHFHWFIALTSASVFTNGQIRRWRGYISRDYCSRKDVGMLSG
jgi:hypothetical protein